MKGLSIEILSKSLQERFKISPSDFTRNRKQSFSSTVLFISNFIRKSLSLEIENFVSYLRSHCGYENFESFTKSAFVQYRKKIDPEVFKHLSSFLVKEFYTDNDASIKLWNGFRVLAVDGSRITLPQTKELKQFYGEAKNNTSTGVVQGRASVLYDVLNNYVIDGILAPLFTGEGKLAKKHLAFTQENDLIIYDRGYPSFDLIYEHTQIGIDFLFRVKLEFNNGIKEFVSSGKTSQIVEISPGKNRSLTDKEYDKNSTIKVRLIRIKLSGGETEILMTSLLNSKKYGNKIFKELYFKRWGVETFYDELKNKIKVEYFSGYSKQSILQDFNAAMFVSNVQTLIVTELQDELDEVPNSRKYQYKVNNNLSYGFLKDRIVSLLFSKPSMEEVVPELKELFKKHLIPIRPDRSIERRNGKYRTRMKPKVTKNQKDTI